MHFTVRPAALLFATTTAAGMAAAAPLTYYMDEVTQYSDVTMCTNENLNTVSASLASAMSADGWSGSRYVNSSAWPQDFRDSALDAGGLDASYGDAKSVTLFAGHGNS